MGFRLSLAAEEDIIGIAEQGVRLFGAEQARQYHDELFAIFDLIAASPRMARSGLNCRHQCVSIPSRPILPSTGSKPTATCSLSGYATGTKIGRVKALDSPPTMYGHS